VDGWKYIFIVEGAITIAIAISLYFIVVDLPQSDGNKFLNAEEKELIRRRLLLERGDAESEKITWKVIVYTFKQWHVWTMYVLTPSSSNIF
jgi:sugar phosphate permease